jgi:hypothetical protein
VIDLYVFQRRDITSAGTFFTAALTFHGIPAQVITDRAPALANVIEDLIPAALHNSGQYENNRVESDDGGLKGQAQADGWTEDLSNGERGDPGARVRPEPASCGHYELAVDAPPVFRFATACDELRRTA